MKTSIQLYSKKDKEVLDRHNFRGSLKELKRVLKHFQRHYFVDQEPVIKKKIKNGGVYLIACQEGCDFVYFARVK